MLGFPSRVKAVLGPTNTGKTHLAMERMLAHASGIIGFPLRLLARENYDRMVAQKGVKNVALITGEEKIAPPSARWFSCTVEAMPLDMPAEFVAVDEIQLCADPDRGHVFTDRMLNARGMVETMFLGAETIRPLLQYLVPQIEIETRPRLSQLTYAGPVKLARLPPRTAVVAFSAGEVYAIAEMIRRRRGGCAVVMGRLSPRTRNAQVQLYQNKEVDFLVATDAIGMGLNMDVDHVAFARLTKFDGHRIRRLTPPEVAQIAGRAGRGMRDGTFGSTAECPPLDDDLVHAVETHHFEPLEQLYWRNAALDLSSVDALLASLQAPPPRPGLVRGPDAVDLQTLMALAREPDIRGLARGPRRVRLLWETCGIPDFRKLADDTHSRLCARVFEHVARDKMLPSEWIETGIGNLARSDGDIDTLMQRLAGVRVWAYIAARTDWVANAGEWQSRTRQVEDLLSDALHERLTARFVDRRAAHLIRRLDESPGEELLSAVTARGEVVVEGHPVGHVGGFVFLPDPDTEGPERRLVLRAARRALREWMPRRVQALEDAPDQAFSLDGRPQADLGGRGGRPAATRRQPAAARHRGAATANISTARAANGSGCDCSAGCTARHRPRPRSAVCRPGAARPSDPSLRGLVHLVAEAGGVLPGATERSVAPAMRGRLKPLGLRAGRFALFLPALLKPQSSATRAALWALAHGLPTPALPNPGLVSLPAATDWPPGFAASLGWVQAGPVLVRLDIAERIAAELAWVARQRPAAVPDGLASRLSISKDALPAALRGLGVRLVPAAALRARSLWAARPADDAAAAARHGRPRAQRPRPRARTVRSPPWSRSRR